LNYTLSITAPHNATNYTAVGCSYTLNGNVVSFPSCTNVTLSASAAAAPNILTVSATFYNGTNTTTNTSAVNFTIVFNFIPVSGSVTTTNPFSVTASDDAFVANDCPSGWSCASDSIPLNHTYNYGYVDRVFIHGDQSLGISHADMPVQPFWKFPLASIHGNSSKIISDLKFSVQTGGGGCGGSFNATLYFSLNTTWFQGTGNSTNGYNASDGGMTWDTKPSISVIDGTSNFGTSGFPANSPATYRNLVYSEIDITQDPTFIMAVYSSSNITISGNGQTTTVCGNGNNVYAKSLEFPATPIINGTVVDFMTGYVNYPRFGIFNPNLYWNFESGAFDDTGAHSASSSSDFPEAEFIYYTNQINPTLGNTISTKGSVLAARVLCSGSSCYDASNTLINLDCKNAQNYVSVSLGSSLPDFNVNADGSYYTYCFNLSSLHGGRPFYAAMKVISVDSSSLIYPARHISFYWAMYGGDFTGFSVPIRNPSGSPVPALTNITETWTTTQLTTTGYSYYWINSTGGHGPPVNFQDTNFTTTHTFTIPANLVEPGVEFRVSFYGTTQGGSAIGSSYEDIFNTTSGGIAGLQGDLLDLIDPLNGGSGGLGVSLFDERTVPIGGYVSLDNYPYVTAPRIECPNCSWTVSFSDGTNFIVYKPWVSMAQFTPDLATIGVHTIRVKDFSGARNRTYTFNIPYIPYALPIHVYPTGCVPYDFEFGQAACQFDFIYNFTGMSPQPTGEFCQYNPTECQLYNYSTGVCMQFARHTDANGQTVGGWVHYVCYNGVNSGYYNSSVSVGVIVPGTGGSGGQAGSVVPALTGPLEQILGMTTEQILAMLSLIISIAVGIFAGAKTKDGMVAVVVIVTMLFLFTIVTWLPFWVAFVLAIIAAFIVARFARGFLSGGGGH
jgi:hypothetical protein